MLQLQDTHQYDANQTGVTSNALSTRGATSSGMDADLPQELANELDLRETTKRSLLDLPGEILNLIARYVLVPGEVVAFASRYQHQRPSKGDPPNRFNLLATCKKIYTAYATMFFSDNTFIMPQEYPIDSTEYLSKLRPAHRALIRHVCIVFAEITHMNHSGDRINEEDRSDGHNMLSQHHELWKHTFSLLCDFHGDQLSRGGEGLATLIFRGAGKADVVVKGVHILLLLSSLSLKLREWLGIPVHELAEADFAGAAMDAVKGWLEDTKRRGWRLTYRSFL